MTEDLGPPRRSKSDGQALVEFSLAVTVFLVLLMGLVDFGSAIYKYNGVSQAAREIARVTSVHPGTTIGSISTEMAAVIATQKKLVPGLTDPKFDCIDPVTGAIITTCNYAVDSVRVTIDAPYQSVTPLLRLFGQWNVQGTSTARIQ
jgi:Flp pilus assembly protein TadG